MIYTYDKERLTFKKVTKHWVLGTVGIIAVFVAIIALVALIRINDVRYISEETKAIIIKESDKYNEFNKTKLKAYILELNIKFPHIVYAQARLESGNFSSDVFRTNKN